jgi:hypothetical protein
LRKVWERTEQWRVQNTFQKVEEARLWWLTPVILATWETEIRRIQFKASLGK